MRSSISSAAFLAACAPIAVSAASLPFTVAPALPLTAFPPNPFITPISLDQAKFTVFHDNSTDPKTDPTFAPFDGSATCTNPRVRTEWDSATDTQKQQFVDALKCLVNKNSAGNFSPSQNRFEDFVRVHQQLTPNVHGNAKFLLWHRFYLWALEDVMRTECGFQGDLLWFDETRYSGKFSQSSIFSSKWFGAVGLNGQCVTDGQFANMALHIGPGTGNQLHCLARAGDAAQTANTNAGMVDACNARTDYADMARCQEGGVHAWGHNGIGAVMRDVYASPSDPVFWLHHGFVDRNFRIWQNQAASRVQGVTGTDKAGNAINLDTGLDIQGLRAGVKIRDVISTQAGILCYKYNY